MAELTLTEKLERDSSLVLLYGWAVNLSARGYASLEQDGDDVIVNCEAVVSEEFGFGPDDSTGLPEMQVPNVVSDFFFAVPWVYARLHVERINYLELACGAVGIETFRLIFRIPLDRMHVDSIKNASMLSMVELTPAQDYPQNRFVIMKV